MATRKTKEKSDRTVRQPGPALTKILIANRGEIAVRIARTCRAMGIASVAVYADSDRDAVHVQAADEAISLGGGSLAETYLSAHRITAAARAAKAEAVHPGYGFLSESAAFARAVAGAGLVFIGPSPEVLEITGDKRLAKEAAARLKIPVVPGYRGADPSDPAWKNEARKIGYPVLVKAAAGGGGRGMRIVRSEGELRPALESASREAAKAFGDGSLLLERYLEGGRHVEVQILGDGRGEAIHLFERECSLQRRHQKVIEEAPAVFLSPALRKRLYADALKIARQLRYAGAGTVEFLCVGGESYYFLEINPRIQVEHPVTEAITGIDIVRMQIEIARGKGIGIDPETLVPRGHAVEARVCAEDARHLPVAGMAGRVSWPSGEGIRIETALVSLTRIGVEYDSLLGKVIASGGSRAEAWARLERALSCLVILGIPTNTPLLLALCRDARVAKGELDTAFLDRFVPPQASGQGEQAAIAASVLHFSGAPVGLGLPYGFRNNRFQDPAVTWESGAESIVCRWHAEPDGASLACGGRTLRIRGIERQGERCVFTADGERVEVLFWIDADRWHLHGAFGNCSLRKAPRFPPAASQAARPNAQAPMPGSIRRIFVTQGQTVAAGDALVVLEAMKMEHTIVAAQAGVVREVFVREGQTIGANAVLVEIDGTS